MIQVAVGVVRDTQGRILISRRHLNVDQGGLWEFPGGKVEPGECVEQALARELAEEVGIQCLESEPLLEIPVTYPNKKVLLLVRLVTNFRGEARGLEGQPVRWVEQAQLADYAFPQANRHIITALQLPQQLAITATPTADLGHYLHQLEQTLSKHSVMLRFRAQGLSERLYLELAHKIQQCCKRHQRLFVVDSLAVYQTLQADGLHLSEQAMKTWHMPTQGRPKYLGCSVHDQAGLERALELGADYLCLSPVQKTTSHPAANPLGWSGFAMLVKQSNVPVYALGGMTPADIKQARQLGGQGIAAITTFSAASNHATA